MTYSIIIVAYKDYASLKKCIASVKCSGIKDYEIIVHDNTPPDHENLGFSAGCNRGAKQAQGDILIFLNPDTIVFGDWADQMAAGLDSECVAVGPVSNYVAGFQKVEFYGGEDRGFIDTKLLIGFCLMIKRETFEELGGMDEKLFLGCDDLDLSWRIQLMGKKMRIASGVFVHHEGHTSMGMNPEKDKLIRQSEDALREKLKGFYGDDPPSSEELWGCKIQATKLKPMRLSVCMIARDASEVPPSYWFADERHVFLAGQVENFAEARNYALSKCTGDWILWLDTDDIVSRETGELIDALIHKPGNMVALQACHFAFKVENVGKDGNPKDSFYQSRLFPRLPGLVWGGVGGCTGLVHESYHDNAAKLGLPMVQTNITIQHTGYSDPELEVKKAERNLNLLLKEPDNCFKWYNIGCSYMTMKSHEKAEEAIRKALEYSKGEDPYFVDNCRYTLALCLDRQGKTEEAVEYLNNNRKPDAKWLLGMLLIDLGEMERGCDLLWAYLKIGDVKDNLGTNCPTFRKAAIDRLTQIGIIA